MNRLNQILLVVLLLQAGVIGYTYWPRGSNLSAGAPLLTGVSADKVTAMIITDDSGNQIELDHNGSNWVVAGTDGFPANSEKVDSILKKLLAIKTDRLVTRTPASQKQLQVADSAFSRRITLNVGKEQHILYVGSSAGAGATHVRAKGENPTYLTNQVASFDLDTQPSGWMNSQYFQRGT